LESTFFNEIKDLQNKIPKFQNSIGILGGRKLTKWFQVNRDRSRPSASAMPHNAGFRFGRCKFRFEPRKNKKRATQGLDRRQPVKGSPSQKHLESWNFGIS